MVVCETTVGGGSGDLASMNSVLRTIGLASKMLAPVCVGQLFALAGYAWTAVVIGLWNVVSVCVEYGLLLVIYRLGNYF